MRASERRAGWFWLLLLPASCGGGSASTAPAATPTTSSAASAPSPAPEAAPAAPPANPDLAAFEAARPSFRVCYDRARAAQNAALGRTTVTLSVRVDETGHVSTVDLEYKHKFDDASKGCMRDAAFAVKLPPGAPRRVEVPIPFDR